MYSLEYRKKKMKGDHMKNMDICHDNIVVGKVAIDHFEDRFGRKLPNYSSGCIIVCKDGIRCLDLGDWTYKTKILL